MVNPGSPVVCLLLANNVGNDGSGAYACDWLHDRGVQTDARMMDGHTSG